MRGAVRRGGARAPNRPRGTSNARTSPRLRREDTKTSRIVARTTGAEVHAYVFTEPPDERAAPVRPAARFPLPARASGLAAAPVLDRAACATGADLVCVGRDGAELRRHPVRGEEQIGAYLSGGPGRHPL